jgi:hypothetical protein
MFTLEESALLGRMLRVMGWLAVCLATAVAGCAVVRYVGPHSLSAHHGPPPRPHAHHS